MTVVSFCANLWLQSFFSLQQSLLSHSILLCIFLIFPQVRLVRASRACLRLAKCGRFCFFALSLPPLSAPFSRAAPAPRHADQPPLRPPAAPSPRRTNKRTHRTHTRTQRTRRPHTIVHCPAPLFLPPPPPPPLSPCRRSSQRLAVGRSSAAARLVSPCLPPPALSPRTPLQARKQQTASHGAIGIRRRRRGDEAPLGSVHTAPGTRSKRSKRAGLFRSGPHAAAVSRRQTAELLPTLFVRASAPAPLTLSLTLTHTVPLSH